MDLGLSGKAAIVTGASRGIGEAIGRVLAEHGVDVCLVARSKDDLAKVAADIKTKTSRRVVTYVADLSNPTAPEAAVKAAVDGLGRLDILVNNAGVSLDFGGVTRDTFRQTYETNVIAPYFITQALLPLLKASPAGRIVNHSSILGSMTAMGDPNRVSPDMVLPAYCSSKAALNMLTVTTARTLEGANVKVNSAHPGWVKTDMGSDRAPMEIVDGAKTAVALALLPDDGPTGGFFHMGENLPW